MWILTPLNFIFSMWKRLLSKLIRIKADHRMTQEELSVLVDEAGEEGGIDSDEVELLRSALEFTELEAGDILTPRVDLEAVPGGRHLQGGRRGIPFLALFAPARL